MKHEHLVRALGDLSNALIQILGEEEEDEWSAPIGPAPVVEVKASWRERVWIVPAETRLGVREVAETLARSKSWVYKKASRKAGPTGLPCRKLDGELLFTAGEVRAWINSSEEVERTLQVAQRSGTSTTHSKVPSRKSLDLGAWKKVGTYE